MSSSLSVGRGLPVVVVVESVPLVSVPSGPVSEVSVPVVVVADVSGTVVEVVVVVVPVSPAGPEIGGSASVPNRRSALLQRGSLMRSQAR